MFTMTPAPCAIICFPRMQVGRQADDGAGRRSHREHRVDRRRLRLDDDVALRRGEGDRKSTRLNSSHGYISYAVFCLKKKKNLVSLCMLCAIICQFVYMHMIVLEYNP